LVTALDRFTQSIIVGPPREKETYELSSLPSAPPNFTLKLPRPGFGPGLKPLAKSEPVTADTSVACCSACTAVKGGNRRAALP
jgi:hypothetical protein